MDRHCLSYNKINTRRLARLEIRWLYLPRLTRIDGYYHSLPQSAGAFCFTERNRSRSVLLCGVQWRKHRAWVFSSKGCDVFPTPVPGLEYLKDKHRSDCQEICLLHM